MLDDYVAEVRKYLETADDIDEISLIAHVYLDLGNRLSFDTNFLPFGNSKRRQAIYSDSIYLKTLEKCMEENIVICRSLAYILKYILEPFGIDIIVVTDSNDYRKTPHVYNVIRPKDGIPFIIDLQEDMYRIKVHDSIENFGMSLTKKGEYVIPRFEQKKIFEKLGYYTYDDYYDNMKLDLGYIESFKDKIGFVLTNIDLCETPNINHIDRQWGHVRKIEKFFDKRDFNYCCCKGKIQFRNCYRIVDGKRIFYNVVVVDCGDTPDIYIYDEEEFGYIKVDFMDFAAQVKDGLVIHDAKVRGLKKAIARLSK